MGYESTRWTTGRGVVTAIALIVIGVAGRSIFNDLSQSAPRGRADLAPRGTGPTRDALLAKFDITRLTIAADEIRHGGPPKDGIPSLTTAAARPIADRDTRLHGENPPAVVPLDNAHGLLPDDRVVGVTIHGEMRAYPIKVLNWHEVINDVLGGQPIAVIYCPLCDSVSVIDRRVGDTTLEFGISGLLYNSNVLLYDRTDNALWSQESMGAVSGPHAGQSLEHLWTWRLVSFATWREAEPDSTVVGYDTGHRRNYAAGAYRDYFATDRLMFPVTNVDERLKNKTAVIGVTDGQRSRAYPLTAIHGAPDGLLRDAWDDGEVLLRSVDGVGVAIENLPVGTRTIHTFWFAWAAFHPQSQLFGDTHD